MRLNRFLSTRTELSRRSADEAIADGRVRVNGQLVNLGVQIEPSDIVSLDEVPVPMESHRLRYVAYNKPSGLITSRGKQGMGQTIYNQLPPELFQLKPVGRLDKDSCGLLILTNDGDFHQQASHPRYQKQKVYFVKSNPQFRQADIAKLQTGIMLRDGLSEMQVIMHNQGIEITISQGRNRQIRRTLGALGYQVTFLQRVAYGKLKLAELAEGHWRDIEPGEVL